MSRAASSPRRRAVLAVLVLAGVGALAAAQTWVRAVAQGALGGVAVTVSGAAAAPEVIATALALAAAGLSLALVGARGRWVVAAVLAVGALVQLAVVLRVVSGPTVVASARAAELVGVDALRTPAATTAWPWVTAATALAVLVVAVDVVRSRDGWSRGSRHDRAAPSASTQEPSSVWDALSRGEDPTRADD